MKTFGYCIFLLAFVLVSSSFIDKDLNEYGKWLKFHGFKEEDFSQTGVDKELKLNWQTYKADEEYIEYKKIYDSLYFYSFDKSHFLDLDSYDLLLKKDSTGALAWEGGEPEQRIQLINTKEQAEATIFFSGLDYAETALWRSESLFEIYGFLVIEDNYVPVIWKYDLIGKTIKEFRNTKTFKTRPKSYLIEVRLKSIKEKKY